MNGVPAGSIHGSDMELLTRAREAQEYLDGWKRARADYENLSRRALEEKHQARQEGAHAALLSLITVADHFDAALASVPAELAGHPWVQGVRHIHTAFTQALMAEGIDVVDTANIPFDPRMHEAVEHIDSDLPAGTIVEIVARGYKTGDRVLRPARVRVSAGQSGESLRSAASAARGATQPSTSATNYS